MLYLLLSFALALQAAPPLPATVDPSPVKLPSGMYGAREIHHQDPSYPIEARIASVQGVVVMRVTIGRDGQVQDVKPLSGPAMLWDASVAAVRSWTYEPYLIQNQPVAVTTLLSVDYSLNRPGLSARRGFRLISPNIAARLLRSGTDPSSAPATHKGVVRLRIFIGHSGDVISTQADEGPKDLVKLAQAAVATWKYAPYDKFAGTTDQVETTVAFDFQSAAP